MNLKSSTQQQIDMLGKLSGDFGGPLTDVMKQAESRIAALQKEVAESKLVTSRILTQI